MEQWEQIKTIERDFDVFLENLPKADRKFLCSCGSNAYDRFISLNYIQKRAV